MNDDDLQVRQKKVEKSHGVEGGRLMPEILHDCLHLMLYSGIMPRSFSTSKIAGLSIA